jgi:hypothetical protein
MSFRFGLIAAGAAAAAACTDPPHLSTTDQAVNVSPSAWDFGSSQVGVETGPHSFVVGYGAGYGSDTVLAITSCPDFRVDLLGNGLPYDVYRICDGGGGLPPAVCEFVEIQTLVFDVYFRPSVAGPEGCTLVVDMQTSVDKIVSLSGTGTAPPIDITLVQPAGGTVDFGDVLVGSTSAPRTITVRSDGGSALDITGAAVAGAGFAQTGGTAPIQLQPTQSQDYTVTCAPGAPGVITGSFTITSNDPDESSLAVALRCNGIQSALAINPSPATLPITRVGESSELALDLVNTGSAGLTLESVAIAGDGLLITQQPGATALAAGASTQMRIGFTPIADGDVAGTLTATYDGGQTRQVGVTAPGRISTLSVTPAGDVDFGPICVGQTDVRNFIALDTGTAAFVVQTVALAGTGFTLTPIAPTSFPATVQPLGGSTVSFQVAVAPAAAGDLGGSVSITTDIPALPTTSIGLHALGLAGGTTATPTELDTGSAVVGEGGGARLVTLSNCEAEPLTIVLVGITGLDMLEFAIVTAPTVTDIAPGSSVSWLIELRPTSPGEKTATFHIEHSRGVADVALVGDGLDPSGHAGGDGPRGSYYACAATRDGGGTAAIVIVLAAAAAVGGRRRRR